MRRNAFFTSLALGALTLTGVALTLPSNSSANVRNGAAAPDFGLPSAQQQLVQLSDFRGQTVVLEWHNPGCPFVQKHYNSGNMQRTQQWARDRGVVWLTINSGAVGRQGHMTGPEARDLIAEQGINSNFYLFDPRGTVGHDYGARTTPHMYVINANGRVVYQGGIDDRPTANPADIEGARNHVMAALTELAAGDSISVPTSRAYGCSVKYADE